MFTATVQTGVFVSYLIKMCSQKTEKFYRMFEVRLTLTHLLLVGQSSFIESDKEVLSPFVVIR